jgi:hypothetical protein
MNTTVMLVVRTGFFSPIVHKKSVNSATCPRQSVVPRPNNLSPSIVNLNGSTFQVSGLAGCEIFPHFFFSNTSSHLAEFQKQKNQDKKD